MNSLDHSPSPTALEKAPTPKTAASSVPGPSSTPAKVVGTPLTLATLEEWESALSSPAP